MFGGLVMVLASGCASKQQQPAQHIEANQPYDFDDAITASSSALLFDPPMYAADLPPDLSREGREPSAFVAYEDQTISFSYTRTDDRQVIPDIGNGRYERRAIVERFGSSKR